MSGDLVSFVIRVRNEAEHLADTLESVYAQDYRPLDVIIVDSGSTDGTLEIARKYPLEIIEIPHSEFTFGRALNIGCRQARGTYLAFLSGHSRPWDEGWLSAAVRHFEDPKVAGVSGDTAQPGTHPSTSRTPAEVITADNYLSDYQRGMNNAGAVIRRDVWEQFPFNEALTGCEDSEWALRVCRAGYRVVLDHRLAVFHEHHESAAQQYHRSWREHCGWAEYLDLPEYSLLDLYRDLFIIPLKEAFYPLLRAVSPARMACLFGKYQGLRAGAERRQEREKRS